MRTLALLLLAVGLGACGGADEERGAPSPDAAAYRDVTPEANRALREAPMLAARVARGELPPLDERLPETPMVVPVVDTLGLYGGTWRSYDLTPEFLALRLANHTYGLTRWSPDASEILPGVAERWEESPDGTTVTFHLRRGVRWSDGAPFSSDDLLFWWSLALDERYAYQPPEWAYASGQRMDVTAPDSFTVVFSYPEPYVLLPLMMATGFWTPELVLLPAHYLRRFHPDFSDQPDFNELDRRRDPVRNADRPTLAPWRLAYYSPTGDRAVYERNPYYWAVDPAGRQLPYLDRIEVTRVQSQESGVLLVMAGKIDLQFRWMNLADHALLERFADTGDYRVLAWEEGTASWHAGFINLDQPDPARRALFRDPDFRRGLALAVDRERLNQVVFGGSARPQAAAITDESWHFRSARGQDVLRRWRSAWSAFDPEAAARHLDAAGLDRRDADGFRLWDGQPFTLRLDHFDIPYASDEAPLLAADWEAVGIRTRVHRASDVDLRTRIGQGDFDLYLEHNSELDLMAFPNFAFPVVPISWHPLTGSYVATGGERGTPPTGFMVELVALYERLQREPDLDARHGLVLDAIDIQIENGPFMIGTAGRQKALVVAKTYVRNLPATAVMGPWAQPQPGTSYPEQFFYDAGHLYPEAAVPVQTARR